MTLNPRENDSIKVEPFKMRRVPTETDMDSLVYRRCRRSTYGITAMYEVHQTYVHVRALIPAIIKTERKRVTRHWSEMSSGGRIPLFHGSFVRVSTPRR